MTGSRFYYQAVSHALEERWEDKASVQRDFGTSATPRYESQAREKLQSWRDNEGCGCGQGESWAGLVDPWSRIESGDGQDE